MRHLEPIRNKWLLFVVLPFISSITAAQFPANKPGSATQAPAPTGQIATRPADYASGIPVNYIRTWDAMGAYQSAQDLVTAGYQHVKESTQYLDGLGRPVQTVARQFSPGATPKDMVAPIVYDQFGREILKYLAYVQSNNVTNDGKFRLTAFTDQDYFYKNIYKDASNNVMYAGEQALYNRIDFEPSPLNRVSREFAAGNSWAGSYGSSSEKANANLYLVTTSNDDVKNWTITNNPLTFSNNDVTTNIPSTSQAFLAGELSKNVLIDEHGNAIVQYIDKKGKLLLKKEQIGTIAADYSGNTGFLCTYFIYDDFDQLRFIIPPKAVEAIKTTWTFTATIINELCFRYEYDEKERMIARKSPGAGWVYMVYDTRDRLIFTQDANMRDDAVPANNKWLTVLYDGLNRAVLTGMISYSGNLTALQGVVNTQTQTPVPATDEITIIEGMSINKNPIPPGATFVALTISYFDSYTWTSKTYSTTNNAVLQACDLPACNNLHVESLPAQSNTQVIGILTGSKTRVVENPATLSAGTWLSSTMFYDNKDRMIQVQVDNSKGRTDIATSQYDFSGKVVASYSVHTTATAGPLREKTILEYDYAGRLIETWKIINDETAKRTLISKNEYDELGRVKRKELGRKRDINGNYTTTPIETLDYSYNIRNWLKGINKYYANNGTTETDRWFGLELNYDWGFATSQYNGNVAGTKWRSRGDGERRSFGYGYDKIDRIMGADFAQHNGSSYVDNASVNFDMQMGDGQNANSAYDENGNIKAMKQWGLKFNTSAAIDDMVYGYFTNSNKLSTVTEQGSGTTDHKLGDFTDKNTSGNDYGYDKNGNLVTDLNKRAGGTTGIDLTTSNAIIYNHLNLPWKVTIKNDDGVTIRGTITYSYDASGNKVKKVVVENPSTANGNVTITTTTSYVGRMIYESKTTGATVNYTDKLQFFTQDEGRVRPLYANVSNPAAITGFAFDYMIKDNLGNTRMLLTDEQQLSQYPALSYEGAAGSPEVTNQNTYWENSSGQSISVTAARTARPGSFGTTGTNGDYAQLLRKSTGAIGPVKLLRVMTGDKIHARVDYFYTAINSNNTGANGFASVMGSLANVITNSGQTSALVKSQASGIATQLGIDPGATSFFAPEGSSSGTGQPPKAYMHVLLFDEMFRFDNVGSFVQQVPYTPNVKGTIDKFFGNAVEVRKNGYAYIYISNESDELVYFDNFLLTHERGPLLEETHYYPYGLTMTGISSKAAGTIENKNKKFNGYELNSDFDLNLYESFYRLNDPQIGRFIQIDPKPSDNFSPYASMEDNPVLLTDPLGDIVRNAHDEEVRQAREKRDAARTRFDNVRTRLNVRKGLTRKSFKAAGKSKADWKEYKKARNSENRAEKRLKTAQFNQFEAQQDINQLQHDNPTIFNALNNLPVDVYIGRTSDPKVKTESGGGANVYMMTAAGNLRARMFNLDDLAGRKAPPQFANGIAIWIQTGRAQAFTLLHEAGHTLSMYGGVAALNIPGIPYGTANNPRDLADYVRNYAAGWGNGCDDCRANPQNCNPTARAATAAERLRPEVPNANRYVRQANPFR